MTQINSLTGIGQNQNTINVNPNNQIFAKTKPMAADSVSFSGKHDSDNLNPEQKSMLISCIKFAKNAGKKFKEFSRVKDFNATFSFMSAKSTDINPGHPEQPYLEALFATAKSALKGYKVLGIFGKVTPEKIEKDQKKIFNEIIKDIPSTKQFAKEQRNQIKQLEKEGVNTAGMEDILNKQLPEREKLFNEQKQESYGKFKDFANNWAALDGDASTVSEKDMAIYLMASDAQDGVLDGKFTKAEEITVASNIAKGKLDDFKVFVDEVDKNSFQ